MKKQITHILITFFITLLAASCGKGSRLSQEELSQKLIGNWVAEEKAEFNKKIPETALAISFTNGQQASVYADFTDSYNGEDIYLHTASWASNIKFDGNDLTLSLDERTFNMTAYPIIDGTVNYEDSESLEYKVDKNHYKYFTLYSLGGDVYLMDLLDIEFQDDNTFTAKYKNKRLTFKRTTTN